MSVTRHNGYVIASDSHEAADNGEIRSCIGCAFNRPNLNKVECRKHACFSFEFPEGHPLHHATNVIWINREAAA